MVMSVSCLICLMEFRVIDETILVLTAAHILQPARQTVHFVMLKSSYYITICSKKSVAIIIKNGYQ